MRCKVVFGLALQTSYWINKIWELTEILYLAIKFCNFKMDI